MEPATSSLTVYFEDPFWVGLFERRVGNALTVCKITFGAEPRDCEVYDFVLRHYAGLRFGPPLTVTCRKAADSPKRRQRAAGKQLENGPGTKAQQALQLQREANKLARREQTRAQKDAEQARQFALRQQKRREKHRGH